MSINIKIITGIDTDISYVYMQTKIYIHILCVYDRGIKRERLS